MLEQDIYFFKKKVFEKIKPKNLNSKFHKILFLKIVGLIVNEKDLTQIYNKEIVASKNINIYVKFVNKKIDNLLIKFKKYKITTVFLSEKTYFDQIKMNNFFKSKSINTASISINNKKKHHKGFKINISLSLFEIIILLSKSKNLKIFSQGWLFRYHQNYLIDYFKGSNTHILSQMDTNSFLFPKYKSKKISRLMKIVWGHDAKLNHELQLFCENYLFKNCDKVLLPGSINHIEDLKLNRKDNFTKYFVYGPYPQKKYFAKPIIKRKYTLSKINLVFAGGIPPFDNRRVKQFYGDAQFATTAKIILSQGINLTVLNNPLQLEYKFYKTLYQPHYKLMKKYKNKYKFRRGFVGKEVATKLANYDFGLMIYDWKGTTLFGENHFKDMIPTKFFSYMEACLPILVSSRWTAVSEIVQRYNLGIVVSEQSIYDLKSLLKNSNIGELKKNVYNYRNLFKDFSQSEFLLDL